MELSSATYWLLVAGCLLLGIEDFPGYNECRKKQKMMVVGCKLLEPTLLLTVLCCSDLHWWLKNLKKNSCTSVQDHFVINYLLDIFIM